MVKDLSTKERLLAAGLHLVEQEGFLSLSIRKLCRKTNANTGSFVYHFGTRDAFLSEMIEQWYQPLFSTISTHFEQKHPAISQLKAMLIATGTFFLQHKNFITHLFLGASAQEPAILQFLSSLKNRHPKMLLSSIRQAQEENAICADDEHHILLFLVSVLAWPVFLMPALHFQTTPPEFITNMLPFSISLTHLEQRINWALAGLSPRGEIA